jgi:hypothetical protein
METWTIINGVIIAVAVYCFADAHGKRKWIARLQEELQVQRKELREWQNKALLRHGTAPLDKKPTRMAKQQEITPKVVTRQQLEYRDEQPMQTPINIHAHDVSYQRVSKTVEKAAEIIAAHK